MCSRIRSVCFRCFRLMYISVIFESVLVFMFWVCVLCVRVSVRSWVF